MSCVLCKGKRIAKLFTQPNGWVMGKCKICDLVQVAPMPDRGAIAALYHDDQEHFDPYIAQETVHHAYFKLKIQEILKHFRGVSFDRKPLRLLDIGCLTGILLSEAKRKGMKAIGVDISRDAVQYCRKKKFTAYEGTIMTVKNLKPSSFDVVTAFQVIEHERDPLTMMKRIHKLLKKGGVVVLATPNYGGAWSRLMGRRWVGFTHPEHVVLFDFGTMKSLLRRAGFRDISVTSDTPRPFPLSFLFTRGADYFPWAAWLLRPIGKLLDKTQLKNPLNPWDDMIVFGRK